MQQSFLAEVAHKLYGRYEDEISSLTLVFPSRRARLFFSDALAQIINKPIWQPQYISMDDVMKEASSLEVGEKVLLITELYKIYSRHHQESFDKFYFWGEMLLGDFDLIDKYMIDASMLFSNIYDLKELEADLSYLTPEMRQIISTFWSNFSDKAALSDEKREFLKIWLSLGAIYDSFQQRMEQMKIGYAGKIYRSAVKNIEEGVAYPDTSRHYVFIGFNALSECEKKVLKYLSNNCECDFYWDYDNYYTSQKEQEAGMFLRENLKLFPPKDEITHNNFIEIKKKIQSISTVSNAVQCKYVNTLLREISPALQFDKRTAIVLTDESLLTPLLHSLPEELQQNVNVTMGYPMRPTTAYSFIERLIELQKNSRTTNTNCTFYHVDVTGILSHPYIIEILGDTARKTYKEIIKERIIRVEKSLFEDDGLLSVIFSPADNYGGLSKYILNVISKLSSADQKSDDSSLKLSYLTILAQTIAELDNCLKKCDIEISTSTYVSLLRRHLQGVRVPFSGEPLHGLQIMGILETRNLDFDNVIILSMNDDNFPGNMSGSSSFIPYNLRAAYGIPTPEHHEGVYAYYFYRLIQRAKRVDMLYCSHADEKSTGEQSRYIYQLDFESPYPVKRTNVGVDVALSEPQEDKIEKSGNVLKALERYTSAEEKKILAPSVLSNYVACPMKFYFSSIISLKTPDELTEEVDSPMFGTILHDAMQTLYTDYINTANPAEHLKQISQKRIEEAVDLAIKENFLKKSSDTSGHMGNLKLIKRIIVEYISKGIIPYDIKHNNFTIMSLEKNIETTFKLSNDKEIKIGGRADRIDSLDNGALRVVDYKTGKQHLDFASLEALFNSGTRSETANILQTLIYSMVLSNKYQRNVQPVLYYARDIQKPNFSPRLRMGVRNQKTEIDYNDVREEFSLALRAKLDELFDPAIPFERCPEQEAKAICTYCDFKTICKR